MKGVSLLKQAGRTQKLTLLALFIALQVVFANMVQIPFFSKQYHIGFLPIAVAGWHFGPVGAALVATIGDIIGANLFPTGPYFPGFTLSNLLVGLIYGLCLHRKPINIYWVGLATFFTSCIYLFVNSLWLSMLYSSHGYMGFLWLRTPSFLIEVPLYSALTYLTLLSVTRFPLLKKLSSIKKQ